MGAPGTYGPRGTWRQAGARTGAQGSFDPPGSQQTSSAQEGTRSLSMVQESLIKIPSSILIGWGLLILPRTMRTGSAQAYGSGPTANQIARISWMEKQIWASPQQFC